MNKGRGLTCYQRDAGSGSTSLTEFDCRVNIFLCSLYISSAAEHVLFFSFPLFNIFYTVSKMLV